MMRTKVWQTLGSLLAALVLVPVAPATAAEAPGTAASPPAPAAPHGVWVSQSGPDRVRWSWMSVDGATGYRVAVSTSPTMSDPRIRTVTGRWATFTGLQRGTVYYAVVRTLSSSSTSGPSSKVQGRPGAPPTPIGSVPRDRDSVVWRWATYVGASRYEVIMSPEAAPAESHIVTERTIMLGVERDSSAYFKVRALDSRGHPISAWSSSARAHVPYHPV